MPQIYLIELSYSLLRILYAQSIGFDAVGNKRASEDVVSALREFPVQWEWIGWTPPPETGGNNISQGMIKGQTSATSDTTC